MNNETSRVWHPLKAGLERFGTLKRIDNKCDKGTPDVSYCLQRNPRLPYVTGWLELKYEPQWRMRGDALHVKSLKKEQVLWLAEWPGHAFLLLRVGTTWLLYPKHLVRMLYQDGVHNHALRGVVRKDGGFPLKELLWALTEV